MLKEFGMDYGVKPRMSLVADYEFVDQFKKANCTGLMYGACPDSSGNNIPFELAFMMENEEHAENFLDSLIRWKDSSAGNSNAVALEFIELKNGEYMLSISPDMELFFERMIPPHLKDRINPLAIISSQAKGGMQIGSNYNTFKNAYVKDRRIALRYYIVKNGEVLKRSEKYFIKTEFKFYTEDNVPGDANSIALAKGKNPKLKLKKPPKDSSSNPKISSHRDEDLRYFFPILYKKINSGKWLNDVICSINKSYSQAQISQAICNIVLLERLRLNNPNGIDSNKPGLDLSIIEHLLNVYESFDSYIPEAPFFTKQKIEKQIRMDAKYLTEYLSK